MRISDGFGVFSSLFAIGAISQAIEKRANPVDIGLGALTLGFILYLWLVLKQ
jgi:hypothetical protein